ncbi:MAG: aminotransferase class III-fold pyridoxal phosphate-dependent enzyme, partial [Pseudomonadota bacterium]
EKLAKLTGLGHAFYASDGASATEIALKMSFHYWRNRAQYSKTKFISLQNSYHGETLGALGVTDVAIFKDTYEPLLMQSAQMPSPDFRLAEVGESAEDFALRCAEKLAHYISQHHQELAAFIVEPLVQCAAGMGMYHPVYLRRAREICDQYQIHLIADEIAVGFGRTGKMFACEHATEINAKLIDIKTEVNDQLTTNKKVKPDFICLSKGITGGYLPLSAVLTTDEIYLAFYADSTAKGFLHSHSYTGNPLACSAALATLAIFETDNVLEKNQEKSAYLSEKMQAFTQLPIEHLRHIGMIAAFDVKSKNVNFARDCYIAALKSGLLIRPIGNTVYFMPPYTISEFEIDFMLSTALQSVQSAI